MTSKKEKGATQSLGSLFDKPEAAVKAEKGTKPPAMYLRFHKNKADTRFEIPKELGLSEQGFVCHVLGVPVGYNGRNPSQAELIEERIVTALYDYVQLKTGGS